MPGIADLDEGAEERREVDGALADDHLTVACLQIAQILDMEIVDAVVQLEDRLGRIDAGTPGVADVHAQAHVLVAALDVLVDVVR